MSVTALTGAFGFAPQANKATAGASFNYYRAMNVDFGPVNDERPFPQEVGGVLVPTGAYRAGAYAAGGIDFLPRLEEDFGYILRWVLGEADTITADTPELGVTKHTWTIDGSEDSLPWGTVRVLIPNPTTASELGMQAVDTKAAGLRLTVPQAGLMAARLDLAGRLFDVPGDNVFTTNPGWTPSFEDYPSVPVSGRGSLVVTGLNGGSAIPITGLSVEIVNGLTTPAQEQTIGKYSPDDFTPIAKTFTVRATYKWADPQLYLAIMTGSTSGTDWTEDVFEGQATFSIQSPANVGATATPYQLDVDLPNVVWQVTNPRLAGASLIAVDLIGTAIKAGSDNVAVVDLYNGKATSYSWT